MDDNEIRAKIDELTEQEKHLRAAAEGSGPDDERHAKLKELDVERDRLWDLLRQREAHEEFHQDPDTASERDADTVEGYEQ
jgi:hypothetical protein